MRKFFHSDRIELDRYHNLLTVTATSCEGGGIVTGQVNGRTVRQTFVSAGDQNELDNHSDRMVRTLQRATEVFA